MLCVVIEWLEYSIEHTLNNLIYLSFVMIHLHVVIYDCSLLCHSPTSLEYNLHSAQVGLLYPHIWCCQRELQRHSLCMLAFLGCITTLVQHTL